MSAATVALKPEIVTKADMSFDHTRRTVGSLCDIDCTATAAIAVRSSGRPVGHVLEQLESANLCVASVSE